MKVTNWRRKLAASLVAGGLLIPGTVQAADLDVNLVVNPGFENVDINSSLGGYNAVEIQSWTDGTEMGFAYSHDGSLDGSGTAIPDYANGGIYTGGTPPTGTGSFYFTSNATPGDITQAGQFSQNVDVSTGATGTLIATGEGAIKLSAYFSSFLTNGDFGTLHIDFLDGSSNSLGSAQVSDSDTTNWTLDSSAGLIPVGTTTARVSLFGTPLSGGPDGYIDNVDVQITNASKLLMFMEVNTTTGVATLKNETGTSIPIDYYEITSAGNALDSTGWSSFQDQNLADFPAGNGSGNGWEEAGGSSDGVLSESYLTNNSSVADQAAIGLGALFTPGDPQDLEFRYGVVGTTVLNADFDNDNDADGNDFLQWQQGFGTTFDATDLANWQAEFGSVGGPGGTSTLVTGFVRYVTSAATAVPEPTSVILVGMGLATILAGRRKK